MARPTDCSAPYPGEGVRKSQSNVEAHKRRFGVAARVLGLDFLVLKQTFVGIDCRLQQEGGLEIIIERDVPRLSV